MWKLWLILAGFCFVIESFTIGFFIFWFGIGSILALITSIFISNIFIQSVVFIISSSLLLLLTKPLIKKFVKDIEVSPTNVYSIIGEKGIVVEAIDIITSTGKVKVKGELWSVISDSDIEKNERIRVIGVDGVKLKVEKLNQESPISK